MAAFEDAISETSTAAAPWYVIPADRKWYRNLAISEILVQTLDGMKIDFPEAKDLSGVTIPD
jgi:polyphosphate kinase 2 (PPK2 family)